MPNTILKKIYHKPNYFVIPLLVALFYVSTGYITRIHMPWYRTLTLPSITPPKYIFRLVWPLIYICTTASILFVWNKARRNSTFYTIAYLFLGNATLNVGWVVTFFVLHNIKLAFLLTLLLNTSTASLMILIIEQSIGASLSLLPYLAWGLFASYLNYKILLLNS